MEEVIEFILLHDQPRLVEHSEPRYQLPNRHFISDTAVPLKYKEV